MSSIVFPQGDANVTVPAAGSIAVASYSPAQVFRNVGFPQYPPQLELLGIVQDNAVTTFGPYTNGATIVIDAGATEVLYNVGTSPGIPELEGGRLGVLANALNVTGTVTAAFIQDGIVTSTTAAGVTGTVPTGAVMDASLQLSVGESLRWSVINTGPNTFTVTAAASGHTVLGAGAVGTGTSGQFLTVKTAAATFVSYRVA